MTWKPACRRNKYGNKNIHFDGYDFASIAEKRYYSEELLIDKRAGHISNVIVHPRYNVFINGIKVCAVVLDFEFLDHRIKRNRYIDVKGMYLSESKLRHRMLAAYAGITIEVISGKNITYVRPGK